ncbi:ParA family protein [Acinetobacter sp. A47]|uniref:ParA family protein n=1 Tax=Acinetobacter sp. A47 TaxID=1561217 RepID=UPI00056FD97E|nr:ParA family protein [Acinetobacter sp. A47]
MKTVVIASRKGGSGKTTNARNFAVALIKRGKRVLLIDTDLQGTLSKWWNRRTVEDLDLLVVPYSQIKEAQASALRAGYDYLIIDTPPDSNEAIEGTVSIADFILVPCKASPDDIEAVVETHKLIQNAGKDFTFIVNEAKPNTSLLTLALETLSQLGPIAPTQYNYISHPTSAVSGSTVIDTEPSSKAAEDVVKLTNYVLSRVGE